jgi:Fe-S-cluster containining protein
LIDDEHLAPPDAAALAQGRLEQLWQKIDAFFARVQTRYPGELACRAGCSDCCHRELTVTSVEAAAIEATLRALDPAARAALAARAVQPAAANGACSALEADGRCAIYPARPLVCRSHGLPLRFAAAEERRGRALPVIDACYKNFVGRDLDAVDADCVMDQATLSTLLAAIDAARADAAGEPRGHRVALRALLGRSDV